MAGHHGDLVPYEPMTRDRRTDPQGASFGLVGARKES
jgi:hypothetical protein